MNACREKGDTHRVAEANAVQKTLKERVQLCLSHYSEVQSYSEMRRAWVEEDGEGCCKERAGESAAEKNYTKRTSRGEKQDR